MKSLNFQIRSFALLLLIVLLALGSACNLSNLAGKQDVSAARTENQPAKAGADTEGAANQSAPETNADTNAADIEGTYYLNNHREGRDGYENSLVAEKPENGKIRVSFDGAYFFQANGAETFHDTSAYGTLTINGNIAKGKLTEEGSENGCAIELNFSGERVNLKSSNCDLNVTPDGVYKKGAEDKSKNLDADVVEQDRRQKPADNDDKNRPFVQYDQAGTPNGIVNLMERTGEREGCGEEVMRFSGKAITVTEDGDYAFEFTLVNGNRKRQKISLVLAAEDRLPFDDVRAVIREGNNLDVTFIYCGNGAFATPTAIYKQ